MSSSVASRSVSDTLILLAPTTRSAVLPTRSKIRESMRSQLTLPRQLKVEPLRFSNTVFRFVKKSLLMASCSKIPVSIKTEKALSDHFCRLNADIFVKR